MAKVTVTLGDLEGKQGYKDNCLGLVAELLAERFHVGNGDNTDNKPELPKDIELHFIGDLFDKSLGAPNVGNLALLADLEKIAEEGKLALTVAEEEVEVAVKFFSGNRESTKVRFAEEVRTDFINAAFAADMALDPKQRRFSGPARYALRNRQPNLVWVDGDKPSFAEFVRQQAGLDEDDDEGLNNYFDRLSSNIIEKKNLYLMWVVAHSMGCGPGRGANGLLLDHILEHNADPNNRDPQNQIELSDDTQAILLGQKKLSELDSNLARDLVHDALTKARDSFMATYATAADKNSFYKVQRRLQMAHYDPDSRTFTSHGGPGANFLTAPALVTAYAKTEVGRVECEQIELITRLPVTEAGTEEDEAEEEAISDPEKMVLKLNAALAHLMVNLPQLYEFWRKQEANAKEECSPEMQALIEMHHSYVELGLPGPVHFEQGCVNVKGTGNHFGGFGHDMRQLRISFPGAIAPDVVCGHTPLSQQTAVINPGGGRTIGTDNSNYNGGDRADVTLRYCSENTVWTVLANNDSDGHPDDDRCPAGRIVSGSDVGQLCTNDWRFGKAVRPLAKSELLRYEGLTLGDLVGYPYSADGSKFEDNLLVFLTALTKDQEYFPTDLSEEVSFKGEDAEAQQETREANQYLLGFVVTGLIECEDNYHLTCYRQGGPNQGFAPETFTVTVDPNQPNDLKQILAKAACALLLERLQQISPSEQDLVMNDKVATAKAELLSELSIQLERVESMTVLEQILNELDPNNDNAKLRFVGREAQYWGQQDNDKEKGVVIHFARNLARLRVGQYGETASYVKAVELIQNRARALMQADAKRYTGERNEQQEHAYEMISNHQAGRSLFSSGTQRTARRSAVMS